MTKHDFVKHAIDGGWSPSCLPQLTAVQRSVRRSAIEAQMDRCLISWGKVLLDEAAWEAVGRAAGWEPTASRTNMERLSDAIVRGESAEHFLATL